MEAIINSNSMLNFTHSQITALLDILSKFNHTCNIANSDDKETLSKIQSDARKALDDLENADKSIVNLYSFIDEYSKHFSPELAIFYLKDSNGNLKRATAKEYSSIVPKNIPVEEAQVLDQFGLPM